jgi:uncharacterized repeat protein (TIGR03987 family)
MPMIPIAAILMTAALACYSIGVWSERLGARLRPWHLWMFWSGFVCDSAGTELMRRVAGSFVFGLHSVTGATALLLMLGHATWATAVILRGDERALVTFHRVSVIVWAIWLVPFVSGMLLGQVTGGAS